MHFAVERGESKQGWERERMRTRNIRQRNENKKRERGRFCIYRQPCLGKWKCNEKSQHSEFLLVLLLMLVILK